MGDNESAQSAQKKSESQKNEGKNHDFSRIKNCKPLKHKAPRVLGNLERNKRVGPRRWGVRGLPGVGCGVGLGRKGVALGRGKASLLRDFLLCPAFQVEWGLRTLPERRWEMATATSPPQPPSPKVTTVGPKLTGGYRRRYDLGAGEGLPFDGKGLMEPLQPPKPKPVDTDCREANHSLRYLLLQKQTPVH